MAIKYNKIVEDILSGKSQEQYQEVINELKLNHRVICESECKNIAGCQTLQLCRQIINSGQPSQWIFLRDFLELLYLKDSAMLSIVYQLLPTILYKYILTHTLKDANLQALVRTISANQVGAYNRYLKERRDIQSKPFLRDLYSIHFGKKVNVEGEPQHLDRTIQAEESQSTTGDRKFIKSVLLFVIYQHLDVLSEEFLREYLKAIYLYCGGEIETYESTSSFYLLEKKNLFNLFRYSISEQEIQWMLLALYELAGAQSKFKFELLAAINMIYKKTANEAMFKYSQIAQSIIHLLEDEYTDIFS